MHQRAGRIVDEDQKRAGGTAILEPAMIRAVDLDQLAVGTPGAGAADGTSDVACATATTRPRSSICAASPATPSARAARPASRPPASVRNPRSSRGPASARNPAWHRRCGCSEAARGPCAGSLPDLLRNASRAGTPGAAYIQERRRSVRHPPLNDLANTSTRFSSRSLISTHPMSDSLPRSDPSGKRDTSDFAHGWDILTLRLQNRDL